MKKNISTFLFFLLLSTGALIAQVTFTEVDSGRNFGILQNGGLMGFAWGDYDGDGDLDLMISGGTNNGAMYRNDFSSTTPSDTFRFKLVSGASLGGDVIFADAGGTTQSSFWADLNGDGHLDVINGTLRIFINYLKDSSKFVFQQNLLPASAANGGWGTAAGDFDGDGDIDIAASGGTAGSNGYGPIHIFRNEGDGTYLDVADGMIGATIDREAWNPQFVDADNDGDQDLWMPSIRNGLAEPCYLLMNTGSSFEILDNGIGAVSSIMDSWVDYDNDGDLDLYLIPLGADNDGNPKFYQNDGDAKFVDVAPALGLDSASWVAGSDVRSLAWGDYDNDGDQDLLLMMRNAKTTQLWRNDNNGSAFVNVGDSTFLRTRGEDVRTFCFVDYDNDGWLDVFSKQNGGTVPPRLFRNTGGNGNHWIVLRPTDSSSNTAGIGARVTLYAGGKMQIRETSAGGGSGNNAQLWAHFGLGSATVVDSVIIRFPTGVVVRKTGLAADQYYTVGTVTSVAKNPGELPSRYSLSQNYPNPFNPTTSIKFAVPTSGNVHIVLVNMLGQVVKEMVNGNFTAGEHEVSLNASNLSSGVYFYRMESGNFVSVKKLMLMK